MKLLTDVDVDEVSPVRRAANRRRFILKEDGEELGVDAEIADIMGMPWEHEGAMLDSLRAGGADETVQKAAVAAVRLLKGVEEDLPEPMQELIEKLGREQYPVANGPLNARKDDDSEPDDDEDDEDIAKAYADLLKESVTEDQRQTWAKQGIAMPDGSYYIRNRSDLGHAIHAVGRGKNNSHAAIRAHIKRRAKALGATNMLPEEWGGNQVAKTFEALKDALFKSQDNRAASPDDPGDADEGDDDADSDDDNSVQKGDPVGTHVGPVQKEDGTWDLDGVPEEQRPSLEVILKAQTVLVTELADTRERLAKSEDDLRTREFVAKAEKELGALAGPGELGPVLKEAADKLSPEGLDKLEQILKAANAQVETGDLFRELGRTALPESGERTDPWSLIEKAADEMVEKSGDLSREQAIDRVMKTAEGKRLYAQYMAGEGRAAMAANSIANGGVA